MFLVPHCSSKHGAHVRMFGRGDRGLHVWPWGMLADKGCRSTAPTVDVELSLSREELFLLYMEACLLSTALWSDPASEGRNPKQCVNVGRLCQDTGVDFRMDEPNVHSRLFEALPL